MMDRGVGCMGKPLVRFCEGQEFNCDMDKILWHRRESRRQQRKQILPCSHRSLLSTRKLWTVCFAIVTHRQILLIVV